MHPDRLLQHYVAGRSKTTPATNGQVIHAMLSSRKVYQHRPTEKRPLVVFVRRRDDDECILAWSTTVTGKKYDMPWSKRA